MSIMTWKEFKMRLEKAGVTDDMELFYIDTGNYPQHLQISIDGSGVGIDSTSADRDEVSDTRTNRRSAKV